ncbi:MAG TPA: cytochrome b5 domain-containing protein [Thermodesulfobacteriota bacterium]|nr:cytochrome b5 domain-containing protein [Thermodesulfobacteriota bacterium]
MKEIDLQTLSECTGKEGRPVLVAYEGKVYDLSPSELWNTGIHMNRHYAGKDLTSDIHAAPHTPDVLQRFSQVGVLKKAPSTEPKIPEALSKILSQFPMLRRHPHPMVVYFPIAFMFSAPLFTLLYLLTWIESLELTGVYCLAGGFLFTPLAMLTGWFTWRLNYSGKAMKAVTIKIWLSFVLLLVQVTVLCWRVLNPAILRSLHGESIAYLFLLVSVIPVVTIIGWYGATLTFPVEKE